MSFFPALQSTIHKLENEFDLIPEERKARLGHLAEFIRSKATEGKTAYLNFICTHNSRRSLIAQIWAQAAAVYYSIPDVQCFSGGTEATAFNPRAVEAMRKAGFTIEVTKEGYNPVYDVRCAVDAKPIIAFSKKYDDPFNHNKDFAAIMTCSHADETCPFVSGASKRIVIAYDDPKEFDNTPEESARYDESVHQIGREILFAFSQEAVGARLWRVRRT